MDPFSLSVGVASLVGLTAHTVHVTTIYIREVRHGKEAASEMLRELNALHHDLARLDTFLKSQEALRPFDNTSVLVTSTSACREKLNILQKKLDGAGFTRLSRIRWPLNLKEHRETITELRALAQWIQFALTIDGCALLSKTSDEVLDTLKRQLETFQLVESIGDRTHSIERSLKEQAQAAKDQRVAEVREGVLNWVSSIDHEQKHHDMRVPRVDGTGECFLDLEEFQRWRDEPQLCNNVLWCQGIQG